MDVETLVLLKFIILAGLAYLTFRKTGQINDTQQIARAIKKQCKMEDITMACEPIVQHQQNKIAQQNHKIISYEEFTKYHQLIGREESENNQLDDSEQLEIFSCEGLDQNERISTSPSDEKRETLSRKSSSIFEVEDRENANKLYSERTNLNKSGPINIPSLFKKLRKTPPNVFKHKKSLLKNKTIKKVSFYKKSKGQCQTSRT